MILEKITRAADLPEEWNRLAGWHFQRTDFLAHLEETNPCNQRYYLLKDTGLLTAACVVYSLKLNLFTYSRFRFGVPVNICGIPCSVSCSGAFGSIDARKTLFENVRKREKGLLLLLNLETIPAGKSWITGNTLPNLTLDLPFNSWEEYQNSLRHGYRRRVKRICEMAKKLAFQEQEFESFTNKHYSLYENVYAASQEKLEVLPELFFNQLREPFRLTSVYVSGDLAAWCIWMQQDDFFVFFLCGLDYSYLQSHQVYLNMLYYMLRKAIELKARRLIYGQTSEVSKARTGARIRSLGMAAYHSNPCIRFLLSRCRSLLEYNVPEIDSRVLR